MTVRPTLLLPGFAAIVLVLGAACSGRGADSPPAPDSGNSEARATSTTPATSSVDNSTPTPTSAQPSSTFSTEELVDFATPSVVRVSLPGGVGSGFIIDSTGYIMTNNHVVESSPTNVRVTLADGSVFPAEVLGRDPRADLALLKIDAGRELPALELADLSDVNVGQDVIAIGFALDLSSGSGPPSVTRGIVSALNRAIPSSGILGAVQTDAAINHGNSGGPLVNYQGKVVGINTSLAPDGTTGGLAQNIGFAVGADTVGAVYEEILELGFVDRALLGIGGVGSDGFAAIRPAQAEELGLPRDTEGVLLGENAVSPTGPAGIAGIQGGDLVVRIGDYDIQDESDLAVAMVIYNPGESVEVEVYRAGERMTFDVTLGAADGQ